MSDRAAHALAAEIAALLLAALRAANISLNCIPAAHVFCWRSVRVASVLLLAWRKCHKIQGGLCHLCSAASQHAHALLSSDLAVSNADPSPLPASSNNTVRFSATCATGDTGAHRPTASDPHGYKCSIACARPTVDSPGILKRCQLLSRPLSVPQSLSRDFLRTCVRPAVRATPHPRHRCDAPSAVHAPDRRARFASSHAPH